MKGKLICGVVILMGIIIGKVVGNLSGNAIAENYIATKASNSNHSYLVEFASETNKSLPTMIDRDTRLDTVLAFNNRLEYMYTLVNLEVSTEIENAILNNLVPTVTNFLCTSDSTRPMLENNIPLSYNYRDMHGRQITDFEVTISDC